MNAMLGDCQDAAFPLVPRIGERLAEKYLIEAELGRGGMGVVFAAVNQLAKRRVALKCLLPMASDRNGLERFLREAQAAGSIDHANVVAVYDVGFHGSMAFLVMELLHGEPLSARLQRTGALPVAEALELLLPAMHGIEAAHAHRVLHRDLKPQNIFVCESASSSPACVKVLDFGVSKLLGQAGAHTDLTGTNGLVGTPRYMAPEQVLQAPDVDERADVYAFGAILYETLTGRRSFDGENWFELLQKVTSGSITPPRALQPSLSTEIEQVVLTAMARDREKRYPSVYAMRTALEAARGSCHDAAFAQTVEQGPAAPSRGASGLPTKRVALAGTNRTWLTIAVLLTATILVVGIGMGVGRLSAPTEPRYDNSRPSSEPSTPRHPNGPAPAGPAVNPDPGPNDGSDIHPLPPSTPLPRPGPVVAIDDRARLQRGVDWEGPMPRKARDRDADSVASSPTLGTPEAAPPRPNPSARRTSKSPAAHESSYLHRLELFKRQVQREKQKYDAGLIARDEYERRVRALKRKLEADRPRPTAPIEHRPFDSSLGF